MRHQQHRQEVSSPVSLMVFLSSSSTCSSSLYSTFSYPYFLYNKMAHFVEILAGLHHYPEQTLIISTVHCLFPKCQKYQICSNVEPVKTQIHAKAEKLIITEIPIIPFTIQPQPVKLQCSHKLVLTAPLPGGCNHQTHLQYFSTPVLTQHSKADPQLAKGGINSVGAY